MAYRELGVIEIREVLRRFCVGEGVRAIARGTGSDRTTVGKYVAAAVAAGLRRGDPGPTDAHVAAVRAAIHAEPVGRPRYRSGSCRIGSRSPRGWPTISG